MVDSFRKEKGFSVYSGSKFLMMCFVRLDGLFVQDSVSLLCDQLL